MKFKGINPATEYIELDNISIQNKTIELTCHDGFRTSIIDLDVDTAKHLATQLTFLANSLSIKGLNNDPDVTST